MNARQGSARSTPPKAQRQKVIRVDSPEQWRTLLSPVLAEIVQALRYMGPISIRSLAEWMRRPADALYHHIRKLQDNGFVQEVEFRKTGRHVERIIDVTAEDFAIDFPSLTTREQRDTVAQTAAFYLGTVSKAVQSAAGEGALVLDDDRRNFLLNYDITKLTPSQFREARAILAQLKDFVDKSRSNTSGELYAIAFVVTPMGRENDARSTSRSKA